MVKYRGRLLANKNKDMTITKRIKSFLISLSSVFATAFIAVVVTPQWAVFTGDVSNWLGQIGIPASLITVVGLLIAEAWKQYLNSRAINQASMLGSGTRGLDLY